MTEYSYHPKGKPYSSSSESSNTEPNFDSLFHRGLYSRLRCWLLYFTALTYIFYESAWKTIYIVTIIEAFDYVWRWVVMTNLSTSPEAQIVDRKNSRQINMIMDIFVRLVLMTGTVFLTVLMFYTFNMNGLRGFNTTVYVFFALTFEWLRMGVSWLHDSMSNLTPPRRGDWLDWMILPLHAFMGWFLFQSMSFGEWQTFTSLIIYTFNVAIALGLTTYMGYLAAFVLFGLEILVLSITLMSADISRRHTFSYYIVGGDRS